MGDGENLGHCKKVAQDIGVVNRVQFLGARSDVAELIAKSLIGIQSSNWEGFGLTAVEIMACGKPIVATNVNGLKQVVEGAGLLFEVGDYKTLSKIIAGLINNKNQYDSMVEKSKKRAEEYNIEKTAEKYINAYMEVQ